MGYDNISQSLLKRHSANACRYVYNRHRRSHVLEEAERSGGAFEGIVSTPIDATVRDSSTAASATPNVRPTRSFWTKSEDAQLLEFREQGLSYESIADKPTGRTPESCRRRVIRMARFPKDRRRSVKYVKKATSDHKS